MPRDSMSTKAYGQWMMIRRFLPSHMWQPSPIAPRKNGREFGLKLTPSEGEVIQKFFDEMSAEQNLADMSVGEFMVSAQVSISVLSPPDLEKYLESDNS